MSRKRIKVSNRWGLTFLLYPVLICVASYVEATSFQDADDMGEAAGMMENRIVDVRIFQRECASRQSELSSEIQDSITAWQKADALEIRKANYYWSVMGTQHPEETKKINEAMTTAANNLIDQVSKHGSDEKSLAAFCKNYFASLLLWRKRTPKMYQLLSQIHGG